MGRSFVVGWNSPDQRRRQKNILSNVLLVAVAVDVVVVVVVVAVVVVDFVIGASSS